MEREDSFNGSHLVGAWVFDDGDDDVIDRTSIMNQTICTNFELLLYRVLHPAFGLCGRFWVNVHDSPFVLANGSICLLFLFSTQGCCLYNFLSMKSQS